MTTSTEPDTAAADAPTSADVARVPRRDGDGTGSAADPSDVDPTGAGRGPALATLTRWTVLTNIAIVLTGGLVRLTGSGLGCPRWPTCDGTSVVPRATAEEAPLQQALEFGNRVFSGVVLAVAVWAFLRVRRERPELLPLALLVPAGVVGQAVLGGVTVLTGLDPLVVAAHFMVSMAIIAAAVAQHHAVRLGLGLADLRAGPGGWGTRLTTLLTANGFATLVLGTLVTAAGPHAGDPGTPRLGLDIRAAALLHADSVWLLVGLTIATAVVAHAVPNVPVAVRRAAVVLLAAELAQGTVGYAQYALGIPEALVALHLLGACAVWVALVHLWLTTRTAATGSTTVVA